MERLTFEGDFCDIAQCTSTPGGSFCEDGACSQREIWERLKAYEDTGLTPEEITAMRHTLDEYHKTADPLLLAKVQGRLVVLPCKVGDTVYRIHYQLATYPDESEPQILKSTFALNDLIYFERSVFLTREEAEKAEKALEAKQNG